MFWLQIENKYYNGFENEKNKEIKQKIGDQRHKSDDHFLISKSYNRSWLKSEPDRNWSQSNNCAKFKKYAHMILVKKSGSALYSDDDSDNSIFKKAHIIIEKYNVFSFQWMISRNRNSHTIDKAPFFRNLKNYYIFIQIKKNDYNLLKKYDWIMTK